MVFVSNILISDCSDSLTELIFKGFFKYMYKYFVPDEPDGGSIEFISDKVPSAPSRGDIVPLYRYTMKMVCFLLHLIYYSN